jgi:hypothetical protein
MNVMPAPAARLAIRSAHTALVAVAAVTLGSLQACASGSVAAPQAARPAAGDHAAGDHAAAAHAAAAHDQATAEATSAAARDPTERMACMAGSGIPGC